MVSPLADSFSCCEQTSACHLPETLVMQACETFGTTFGVNWLKIGSETFVIAVLFELSIPTCWTFWFWSL